MAQLPGERFLIQQESGVLHLFDRNTEEDLLTLPLYNAEGAVDSNAIAQAQKTIHDSPVLTEEEKSFAHFWCGYFYSYACNFQPEEVLPT